MLRHPDTVAEAPRSAMGPALRHCAAQYRMPGADPAFSGGRGSQFLRSPDLIGGEDREGDPNTNEGDDPSSCQDLAVCEHGEHELPAGCDVLEESERRQRKQPRGAGEAQERRGGHRTGQDEQDNAKSRPGVEARAGEWDRIGFG